MSKMKAVRRALVGRECGAPHTRDLRKRADLDLQLPQAAGAAGARAARPCSSDRDPGGCEEARADADGADKAGRAGGLPRGRARKYAKPASPTNRTVPRDLDVRGTSGRATGARLDDIE